MTHPSPEESHRVADAPGAPRPGDHRRLWTPWRMRYVGGGATEDGCVFCRRLDTDDDVQSLILRRGERVFAIMNLYPYNTGHLMLVPYEHVASPEDAAPAALQEMATLLPSTLRALRRVLRCDGFNVGFNVGADAGAGVADHLHQHVVPRWEGDANFMPILAATMVLPELIPVTYAKVRAELSRERSADDRVTCVVFGPDRRLLAQRRGDGWRLPTAGANGEEPLWQAARRAVGELVGRLPEVVGWAGPASATAGEAALALAFLDERPAEPPGQGAAWIEPEHASLSRGDAQLAELASARYDVGGPPR